ncbi:hypothetical protein SALBM217S_00114 [Streptomyces griseoloalbus]
MKTATRRDLDDPATVRSVTEAGGTRARQRGCTPSPRRTPSPAGPAAWSSRRASLVADVVKRVSGVPAGHAPPDPEEAAPTGQHERLAPAAVATGAPVLPLRARTEPPAEPSHDPEPHGADLLTAGADPEAAVPRRGRRARRDRLPVRTADLRSRHLPDGVYGSAPLPVWRVADESVRRRRPPGSAPTWSAPWTTARHLRRPRRTGRLRTRRAAGSSPRPRG